MDIQYAILYLLLRVENKLDRILAGETKLMALGQTILDAVTAESTVIDSFIALVNGLVANNTVPADVAANILAAIASDKAKLEAAIVANTPPTP